MKNPERFKCAFLSRVTQKKERERSLSSDRARSYEKGCPPLEGIPDSLIATQAISGRIPWRNALAVYDASLKSPLCSCLSITLPAPGFIRGDLRAEDELGKRSPVRLQSPGPHKSGQTNLFHSCFGYGEQIERV